MLDRMLDQIRVQLMQNLGITFHEPRLLQNALIHRSYLNEYPLALGGLPSNERLEFLGDAVLNLVAAQWLCRRFPQEDEGELTRLRAALVKEPTLAQFAHMLDLRRYVQTGQGVNRRHPGLLADVFEAVVGAVFLDQGLGVTENFLDPLFAEEIAKIQASGQQIDAKTRLQHLVQQQSGHAMPKYRTVDSIGPDHQPQFQIEVLIDGECVGTGRGSSKKAAEQAAARDALEKLNQPEK